MQHPPDTADRPVKHTRHHLILSLLPKRDRLFTDDRIDLFRLNSAQHFKPRAAVPPAVSSHRAQISVIKAQALYLHRQPVDQKQAAKDGEQEKEKEQKKTERAFSLSRFLLDLCGCAM